MKDPMTDIKKSLDATVFKNPQFTAKNKNAVFQKIHKPKKIYVLPSLVGGLLITVLASAGIYFASERLGSESPIASEPTNLTPADIPPINGQGGTQTAPVYAAKNKNELSMLDAETAYEMCVNALTDYYKAIWNGTDIDLDQYIGNENLKEYMQTKVESEYKRYGTLDGKVKQLDIGDWEVKFSDDEMGGYLYLKVPVAIQKHHGGGYGEPTEFFIRNVDGKLAIVDWYTGGKDTYDYLRRGYQQKIDDPDIWNDSEWVKKFKSGTGLFDFEQKVYDRFKLNRDEKELRGLDPISIAKLYVYASYHQDFETVYGLYTDREDHILWSKEEDEEIPLAHRGTPEQILQTFKNIEKGSFVQTGEYEGYIEFYPNGDHEEKSGFSMIKNEDGIWQVAFLPIQ
ncbi:hypothetical protein [Sporosarcina highlanderae]|uniref:Uncharacterized protein n=1 Tax=Sporosarcina highlanderae TaxID=3035916 RepID=A0ABT8JSV9_9BACL|nr:hypothetical protein [Sporosarcina highlanderae]MDN4608243.1 hypothetical protein [Sporosarcina highlanderae]